MNEIRITIFEWHLLMSEAWHAGTVLHYTIMQRAINDWYPLLTTGERLQTFNYFSRHKMAITEIQKQFMARFDPANQYWVHTTDDEEPRKAYLFNGSYWLNQSTTIPEENIVGIEKLEHLTTDYEPQTA